MESLLLLVNHLFLVFCFQLFEDILVFFHDLGNLTWGQVVQSVGLDKLINLFLVVPNEIINGQCGHDGLFQNVKPKIVGQVDDFFSLLSIFQICVL